MHRHSTLLQVQPAMQPYMHKYYSTIRQRMAAEKEEVTRTDHRGSVRLRVRCAGCCEGPVRRSHGGEGQAG